MYDSPFGPYNGGYEGPEWPFDDQEHLYGGLYSEDNEPSFDEFCSENEASPLKDSWPSQETLKGKMAETDALFELFSDMDEDEDFESAYDSNPSTPSNFSARTEQPSVPEKTPSVQARFLSDLTDQVIADGKLLITENGQAFAYQEDGGYYMPVANLEAYLANMLPDKTTRSLLSRHFREIAERLSWENTIRCTLDDFNSHPNLVSLQNGVFNLETAELLMYDRSYRFTYQIHVSYLGDPSEVSCPTFERFCETSLDGDPAKRQLLLEFIGYICTDSTNGKCAMFFKGQPNSGKSVVSSFIARLFDQELVSSIPLHQLADRFFRAELAGKKFNVAGEIAGRALRDISIFKSITGNDRIVGEFKGRDPFYFTPRCKLLFSGNTLPLTTETDATAAFVNRIRVLLFNHSTPPEEQDKQLLDKLWVERDSIVTLALQAVQKLIERNFEFTMPEDSKTFLDAYKLRGNVFGGFFDECCVVEPSARVFNTDLYDAYLAYCKRNGLEVASKKTFYDLLSGVPGVYAKRIRIGTKNRQGHIGITLKEDHNPETLERDS